MQTPLDHPSVVHAFLILYCVVVGVVCIYGLHRYQLVHLYYKYRRNTPKVKACFRELPRVTIQLPMYNELAVSRRIIDATCAIEYPRDRLDIQVLDDSTDETVQIASDAVAEWKARGFDIEYIHRENREGYKAGALQNGLRTAKGDYVLIFDADFLPPGNILVDTIDHFTDPRVGMVQARWEHLNRDQSLLTRTQAILLDGHFVIEHSARNRSGRFMSFNGTAGMWRRTCIQDAGGWQHDTLTEDLDLSYRAQMRGWKFIFLPDLTSAAELPPDMEAFKQQQYRWAKGGAQTCRKLLPMILGSRLPKRVKMEAFFHLTSCTVYMYVVLLSLLLGPALYMKLHVFGEFSLWKYLFDASILLVATCSAGTFYVASQRVLFRTWSDSLKYVPFLMSLGVGIAFNNALAVLAGFFGQPGEFVRTPKFGATNQNRAYAAKHRPKLRIKWQPFVELGIGLYLMTCLVMCLVEQKITVGLPFLCLFMAGYLYVALTTWFGHAFAREQSGSLTEELELAPASAGAVARSLRARPQFDHPIGRSGEPAASAQPSLPERAD